MRFAEQDHVKTAMDSQPAGVPYISRRGANDQLHFKPAYRFVVQTSASYFTFVLHTRLYYMQLPWNAIFLRKVLFDEEKVHTSFIGVAARLMV